MWFRLICVRLSAANSQLQLQNLDVPSQNPITILRDTLLHAGRSWVPLSLNLGVPLFCPTLCQQVCSNMSAAQCLTPSGRSAWRTAQLQLQQQLWQLVGQFGAGSDSSKAGLGKQQPAAASGGAAMQVELPSGWRAAAAAAGGVELPARGLLFDGRTLLPVDVGDCLQGVRAW
jgi:hypothetical protein